MRKKFRPGLLLLFCLLVAGFCVPVAATQMETVSAAGKTGIYQEGNERYYYVNGVRATGWQKVGRRWYYCRPKKDGAVATGFKKINGIRYVFSETGKNYTSGWHKINGKYYYVLKKGRLKKGWLTLNGKKYYLKKTGNIGAAVTGTIILGTNQQYKYTFNSRGVLIKSEKVTSDTQTSNTLQKSTGTATLRNYLLEALRAVGTNYYLGGGWNVESTELSASYDCSGYVGWVTWQFMKSSGTCWTKSYSIPALYASNGWGTKLAHKTLKTDNFIGQFQAGDVIRTKHDDGTTGHVWIVIGQCSDGSYVLVHCSGSNNNGCVQIAGTPTPDNQVGEAYDLAQTYMNRYFSSTVSAYSLDTQGPYGTFCTDYYNYMGSTKVIGFRWDSSIMGDPDGYADKDAAAILKDLFAES